MDIRAVLFDLDGTLLPMDQTVFVKAYFQRLAAWLAPHGYRPTELIQGVQAGTEAMLRNNGEKRNRQVFWEAFASVCGERVYADEPYMEEFYKNDFQAARAVCGFEPQAAVLVRAVKASGRRVALATNPVFPAVATQSRIRWAGLSPEEFELCTTYENIGYCKPNPHYYLEIADRLALSPAQCLMVGNDVDDDTPAAETGMQVFLLTDNLINPQKADIDGFPHGSYADLAAYIGGLSL